MGGSIRLRFLFRFTATHLALLGGMLVAAACGRPPRPPGALTIIDDAGDTVRLARPAQRVVSLSPTTTEILFAIGAGELVVGRTRWCDYPEAARRVESVGDGIPPSIEAVLARRPDLVLLYNSGQNADASARLRESGVAALRLNMDHLADVSRLARLLGPLVERRAGGDSLATSFDSALAGQERRGAAGPRPRILLLAWDQPPIAIGAGSFQSEILRLAGGENLFGDLPASSATVSIEAIAARDPDLILVSDTGPPAIRRRPEWLVVRAVRE
ncbi:MAG: helical backbone metal receptor, partial [Gemmatimonadales bacterium]